MYKRLAFLPVYASVLILVLVSSDTHLLPVRQAASRETMPVLREDGGNTVYLPVLNNKSWPSACYAPGTENYPAPNPDIPEIILQHGTTITVTTSADIINGDVSGVQELISNPGPDGIALREAIEVTNVDPGEYTIRFSPLLDGATIYTGQVGSWDLPPLLGGSVIINGDIDGDQLPDIKISNTMPLDEHPFGFWIHSSGNTLHALELENYFIGIAIKPAIATTTYEDITVSNMIIGGVSRGIVLHTGQNDEGVWASNNHWENIQLINNDLDVQVNGIAFEAAYTSGDHFNDLTISNNTIHVNNPGDRDSFGIQLMAGFWDGADDNVITNATISHNTIQGKPYQGIGILSGTIGAKGNVIDGVSLLENKIMISEVNLDNTAGLIGISLITGDGSTEYVDPDYEPVAYPDDNILRNVDIIGNQVEGFGYRGIMINGGFWGARHNTIQNVSILSNRIHSQIPDLGLSFAGISIAGAGGWSDHYTNENRISNIIVQDNSVSIDRQAGLPDFEFIQSGGILAEGAGGAPGANRNQIRDVWISLNDIDSVIPGINIIGGSDYDTNENVIDTVRINCSTIVKTPLYPHRDPPLKGIVLIGGVHNSTLNRVENISLFLNDVAGIPNDLTVMPNVGNSASNNIVDYQIIP